MTVEERKEQAAHDEGAIVSHTEDDDEGEEEEKDEGSTNAPPLSTFPGNVIPDENPGEIDADNDLTLDYDSDTDYLDLVHLKIQSMADLNLKRFKKLEALFLRQNFLTSTSSVRDLPVETMEELDFYDNRIDHISSAINDLVNLKSLDLSFNKIKNIKNIDKLTKLKDLYFVQNRIKEIKNLETLQALQNLELGGNKIEHISETMLKLPNLTQLWLGKNKILKFENLDNLVNLRVLSIQSNRITKIEGLDKLVNLEELYLSHNGIEKIENLDNNKKLQIIDVTSNKLTSLNNLSHLKELTDFWCSYNKISSFHEIHDQLGGLPNLDTVYFEGNPVQRENPTAYRRKIMLNLGPSLTKIDATYVKN